MKYGWRTFTFDLPEGLEDESVLTFLALRGETVTFNVTVSREPLRGTFESYLAQVVDDLRRALGAYKLVSESKRKVAGLDAKVLEHTATSPEGETLRQLQAHIANGKEVVLVTATGRDDQRDALARALEHILDSWRPLSA